MAIVVTSNPPTPRRCRRMFEAHHLDCQGLSLRQIGARLGRAHSTVHAYLKDFQRHRDHVLRTVAADYLADQLHILTHPETEPDQHRQAVVAARELRLLLLNLPAIGEHDQHQFGNARIAGVEADALNQYPDEPGFDRTELDQHWQNPEDSGPIETNLDKSEHPAEEHPAPVKDLPPIPPNSRPEPLHQPKFPRFPAPRPPPIPVGPQHPASWRNPHGYITPQDADSPLVRRLFGNSRWR